MLTIYKVKIIMNSVRYIKRKLERISEKMTVKKRGNQSLKYFEMW